MGGTSYQDSWLCIHVYAYLYQTTFINRPISLLGRRVAGHFCLYRMDVDPAKHVYIIFIPTKMIQEETFPCLSHGEAFMCLDVIYLTILYCKESAQRTNFCIDNFHHK